MYDEDTGEEVTCPFGCEEWECPHLVAELNLTFNSCEAGALCARYNELVKVAQIGLQGLIQSGRNPPDDPDALRELWEEALANSSDGEVHVDDQALIRLLQADLEETTGVEMGEGIEEGFMQSARLAAFFAEDAEQAAKKVVSGFAGYFK